jgi:RNA polymerase sigma-70 factor, ECF subfamily
MTISTLEKPATCHDEIMRGLYERHGAALERYVTSLLDGDRHAAADIVQETALRVWRNVDGLDVAGPAFRPWLLKVARRLVIDRYRMRMNRPTEVGGDAPDWAVRISDDSDRTLSAMVVSEAIAGLSPDHRDVITELYLRGNSVAGTAVLLGIPVGTVKSRLYYALRALRAAMTRSGLMSPL